MHPRSQWRATLTRKEHLVFRWRRCWRSSAWRMQQERMVPKWWRSSRPTLSLTGPLIIQSHTQSWNNSRFNWNIDNKCVTEKWTAHQTDLIQQLNPIYVGYNGANYRGNKHISEVLFLHLSWNILKWYGNGVLVVHYIKINICANADFSSIFFSGWRFKDISWVLCLVRWKNTLPAVNISSFVHPKAHI